MNETNWREHILNEFIPQASRLTLISDPDGLLLEETLFATIVERGFELITFEDNATFRFIHESVFRSNWDRGETTDFEVAIRVASDDLSVLPYDLLQVGRQLAFGLGRLFPTLSYPVVASLDRTDLDTLYERQDQHTSNRLGDDATKDFVLLHVFGIAPYLVKHPAELLRVLLRRHYRRQLIPRILVDRFVKVLRQNAEFDSWPLETIVSNRVAFFVFLQERWPLFLDHIASKLVDCTENHEGRYIYELSGPSSLPFNHDDIQVYIDNLFIEGVLRPVHHRHGHILVNEWVSVGIKNDPNISRLRRIESLMERASQVIPTPEARHHEWSTFAWRWAELAVLLSEAKIATRSELGIRITELRDKVDRAFLTWMEHRYAGLHNQPPDPPAMLHHVPRYLASRLAEGTGSKVALVVVDGLALDQWIVLRDVIANQRPSCRYHEDVVFAWVPTITSVSRQSIFAGTPPLFFFSSIKSTDKEHLLWKRFWLNQGLSPTDVGYIKGLGNGSVDEIHNLSTQHETRVLGIVVDKVDKIMHGMQLGTSGMHNQVRQWADEGFMVSLLDVLFDCGYDVFLTSDHGNVEGQGCGRPSEGAIADLRGERVRVYSDPILRSRVKENFPSAIEWPALGLPENYLALLAPGRLAFIHEGECIVGHGGISLEEVIVPMVKIEHVAE